MGADEQARRTIARVAASGPSVASVAARDNRFWFGLAFAAAVHAAVIVGVTRSSPRQMGERSGRPDGISVTLVDAPDLRSRNTFREEGAPASRPSNAQPPAPLQPPLPKASEPPAPKQPPAPKSEEALPAPRPVEATIPRDTQSLGPPASPQPATKPSEAESTPQAAPKPEKQAKPQLDLAVPNIAVAPGARAAAVTRPPGATVGSPGTELEFAL